MPTIANEREKGSLWQWRFDELCRAGYPPDVAAVLAEGLVDLHDACDLLKRGCPVGKALEILL